ncbi:MAG: hypothetical protein HQM13_23535 [SAR324 cluster bacterium]|nr:hypothetical protein [SAR324 cluster bacterium]
MDSFFSDVSYSRTGTALSSGEAWATYDNLKEENGESWGSTGTDESAGNYNNSTASITSSYDAFIMDSSMVWLTPAIIPADSAAPRIAATGLVTTPGLAARTTYQRTGNVIYDGSTSSSTAVVLSIAHTDSTTTAGTYLINTTGTNAQHGYSNDGLWNVGDTSTAASLEAYNIVINFNESIVCNSCLATPSGSYSAASAVLYDNAAASSTTLIGSSTNTLKVSFSLSSGASVSAGDAVTIYGVEDTSGNTMPNFTITLGSSTKGIMVSPTSAIY